MTSVKNVLGLAHGSKGGGEDQGDDIDGMHFVEKDLLGQRQSMSKRMEDVEREAAKSIREKKGMWIGREGKEKETRR